MCEIFEKYISEKKKSYLYLFSRIFLKLKVIPFYNCDIWEKLFSRNISYFPIKNLMFLRQKLESFGPNKTMLFFLIEDKF